MVFFLKSFFGPLFIVLGAGPLIFVRILGWPGILVAANAIMVRMFYCAQGGSWGCDGHLFALGHKRRNLIYNASLE